MGAPTSVWPQFSSIQNTKYKIETTKYKIQNTKQIQNNLFWISPSRNSGNTSKYILLSISILRQIETHFEFKETEN